MEKILIITGGSKGLGSGIIAAYKAAEYRIFSISRTKNEAEFAENIQQIQADLSKKEGISTLLMDIFQHLTKEKIGRIVLINNAATLGNISKIEDCTPNDLESTLFLNTTTPLLLISTFIRLTSEWNCAKRIINISSGAAEKAYYGWVTYCASKAALDMITKSVAIEQNNVQNGVKIISIAPGVIDTEMQAEIRKATKSNFRDVERFIDYKEKGILADKEVVGAKIFAIDHNEKIENGAILRVE